jgi:hypothetical protein
MIKLDRLKKINGRWNWKKISIFWIIYNEKIVIEKQGPNMKEEQIKGLLWKFTRRYI